MYPPKCFAVDYIQFLIASPREVNCCEGARCLADEFSSSSSSSSSTAAPGAAPAHDALTRLLQRQTQDTETLWQEAEAFVEKRKTGILVVDDTTLDKPYARKIALVSYHWSGKHKRVVRGINLVNLVWTDGEKIIPCDFRIYHRATDGLTKNDHFQAMLEGAADRDFSPQYVLFDSWYTGLANLKLLKRLEWQWLTRLKANRLVDPDEQGNVQVRALAGIAPAATAAEGKEVHLKGYGLIKVFLPVGKNGDEEYWATNDLEMDARTREELARAGWAVETFHRGLKQCCGGVERAQVRLEQSQRNHILFAIRAFLRLEVHRIRTGISWYEAKKSIIREAIRDYLRKPGYLIKASA